MNTKLLSKIGIICGSIVIGAFLIFLLLPFILNFFIDKYTPQIVGEINKATGLSAGLEDVRIVTTPKLTAGLRVKKFELYTPVKEHIVTADDFEVKFSLIPLLSKTIRIDVVKLENANITLKFKKDGSLALEEYLPKTEEKTSEDMPKEPQYLPFGFKLSNHLPDIHIGGYQITITDGKDDYVLSGNKTDITDFVLNKSIKISGVGKFVLKGREQFNYDIKLFNKIMPDLDLNELVFNPQEEEKKSQEPEKIDIISILKGLYDYKITANAVVNLKTMPDNISGKVNILNVSLIDLTPSNADLSFKGNTININSNIYTAKNELSKLNGTVTTGSKPYINMNFKSDIEIGNVLNIVKKIALIFNIKDLQTLTASGKLNADFNIQSDMKTVKSNGFLKVPLAQLYYGLYKIGIDNIKADLNLANNNININNISLSVLGQPLKIFGTLSEEAFADLHITANKLSLKGLIVALGQAVILKENPVYSGTISMDVLVKGKLDKINPVIKLDIADVNLKNIPLDITVKAPSTSVDITSDGVTFGGTAKSTNVWLINPALKVSIPKISANIKPETIEITQTPVKIEKINTNISGKITNYLTEKIGLDFVSTGDIKSALKGDMNVAKQTLNFVYATTDLSEIIIPMFDKSKMSFRGKINITGSMMNPMLSGAATIPSISIPEIPVVMKDMDVKLNGPILNGLATVRTFENGGIKAENITTDFSLKGNDFYLNNMKGSSFGGKINGNIIYNLISTKTFVDFHGSGMDAEKAIEGAAGIKKALTGTLGFNTKLNLFVYPDFNQMMKSIKGDLDFSIKKGAFGSIGRFESFLGANNIITNTLLKNTVAAVSKATGLANAALFDSLEGKMTLANGWVDLKLIKSAGPKLCYYITGKYNLINGTTNVVILGKLEEQMVAKLGVLGQLSADKVIGTAAARILKYLTMNPAGEKTSEIPALTSGSTKFQEFKVTFNGGIESKSSIKSFKWLSKVDYNALEKQSIKESLESVKSSVNTDIKTTVDNVTNTINTQKQQIKDTKEQIKNSAEEIKNLFKSVKKQETTPSPAVEKSVPEEPKTNTPAEPAPAPTTTGSESMPTQKSESSEATE